MENTVEGPTAVFCTTTNPNVDPETRSRFLVTGIDESSAQTQAILSFQRRYHSPDSLEVDSGNEERLRIHRNFQRLLKNVRVINPFANQLVYDDFRLGARRLQPQYLNLISAIAFLRQMCKGVQVYYPGKGRQPIEYVEVDETDIEIGNRLAVEVLGRTLDELSIPARDLLTQIVEYVDSRIRHESQGSPSARLSRTDITFNRRDIREFTCWTNTRLHTHLRELIDLDYVIIESGRRNSLQTYRLLYSGQGDDGQRFIIGLKPFDNAT